MNLLQLFRGDRRRGALREPTRRVGHLFFEGEPLGQARILDESETGLRIAPEEGARRLPDAITLVEVETAIAHEAKVVWRSADQLGLAIVSEQRLRGFVPEHYQALKAFWESAAVLTG